MFPTFLPSQVQLLKENRAITLAQSIQRELVLTSLSKQAIATAYVHQGKGKPILLLHGFDSSLLEFRYLLPLLARYNETWAVDLLGFGFTERITGIDYNPESIRTHLYSFWQLIKQPLIVVGASMGGATAIDFALNYPQAVEKLVLINSVGFSGDFPIGKFLFPPFDYLAVEYWRQRKLQALYWDFNQSSKLIDAIRCASLHLDMPNWYEAMLSFMKSGGYGDLADKIHKINQPTLILWGDRDDTLSSNDATKFQQAIAQSQLIFLKDCGHVPQIEQPEILVSHIQAFSN
ncbi:alpha/beta fold hydrolase [Gloeocapsopsis dulcis]|uniref:2-hydroxy-6-oxohepta-2,4-dienoate hydrolase n=1 Tax=Gloeocapsopsis dulcis AAB1 = 1H9 TaxID=1433147 RepID=A0A6N8FYX1_9CHRO|nr:alpha/beta fold hydrolase [Gloeocapsopsis dulcis]MUL37924.1 2-hydroxy-6-oxohepta-2,4-dienoate hydrolase [Gloeocapsopsis dulcis AAB1 = 1H9]WNN87320.1 alpha/beta fold hydrolase [Gloeocapsopsis dulcis]